MYRVLRAEPSATGLGAKIEGPARWTFSCKAMIVRVEIEIVRA